MLQRCDVWEALAQLAERTAQRHEDDGRLELARWWRQRAAEARTRI